MLSIRIFALATITLAACDSGPGPTLEPGERLYLGGTIHDLHPSIDSLDDRNPTLSLVQSPTLGGYQNVACFGDTDFCAEHYNSPVGAVSADLGFDADTPIGAFMFRAYGDAEGTSYDVRIHAQPLGHFCEIAGTPDADVDALFPTHRYTTANATAIARKIFGGREYEWFDPAVEIACRLAPSFGIEFSPIDVEISGVIALELWSGGVQLERLEIGAADWARLAELGVPELGGIELAFASALEPGAEYSVVVAELPPQFECRVTELLGPYVPDELIAVDHAFSSRTLDEDPLLDHVFVMSCSPA